MSLRLVDVKVNDCSLTQYARGLISVMLFTSRYNCVRFTQYSSPLKLLTKSIKFGRFPSVVIVLKSQSVSAPVGFPSIWRIPASRLGSGMVTSIQPGVRVGVDVCAIVCVSVGDWIIVDGVGVIDASSTVLVGLGVALIVSVSVAVPVIIIRVWVTDMTGVFVSTPGATGFFLLLQDTDKNKSINITMVFLLIYYLPYIIILYRLFKGKASYYRFFNALLGRL